MYIYTICVYVLIILCTLCMQFLVHVYQHRNVLGLTPSLLVSTTAAAHTTRFSVLSYPGPPRTLDPPPPRTP